MRIDVRPGDYPAVNTEILTRHRQAHARARSRRADMLNTVEVIE